MNKKALITTVGAFALVAVVGVGATLAYFTDSDSERNTLEFGRVDIELDEPLFDEATHNDKFISNVVPGKKITKDPTITVVEGSEDAYLRASIEIGGDLDADHQAQLEEVLAKAALDWGWIQSSKDGYYYYQEVASSENDPVIFFKEFIIPEKWGNDVADATFTIDVKAEAIQATEDTFVPHTSKMVINDEEVDVIDGWFYSDGTDVKAETYVPKPSNTEDEEEPAPEPIG